MCIGQLIIFKLPDLTITECNTLSLTKRNTNGFGSTGIDDILLNKQPIDTSSSPAAAAKIDAHHPTSTDIDDDNTIAYNVICSDNPFMDYEDI